MPLLSFGTYSANLTGFGEDDGISRAVTFSYYPMGTVVAFIAFMLLLFVAFKPALYDADYRREKLWAVVPGIIGTFWFYSFRAYMQVIAFPFVMLTVVLLVWRLLRCRSGLAASFYALLTGMLFGMFSLMISNDQMPGLITAVVIGFFFGAICVIPMIILRFFVSKQISGKRLVWGILFSALLPYLGYSIFLAFNRASSFSYLVLFAYIVIPILIFAALIRHNRWTRDVVTAQVFQN